MAPSDIAAAVCLRKLSASSLAMNIFTRSFTVSIFVWFGGCDGVFEYGWWCDGMGVSVGGGC